MQLPTNPSEWSDHLTAILIAVYIAWDRFTAWKASRDRLKTQEKLDAVHTLVNGKSEAATAKIAELTAEVVALKQEKTLLIAAFTKQGTIEPQKTEPTL